MSENYIKSPFNYIGNKHRYCEACRNQHAQTAKNVLKGIGAGAATVASVAVVVITVGKINTKN